MWRFVPCASKSIGRNDLNKNCKKLIKSCLKNRLPYVISDSPRNTVHYASERLAIMQNSISERRNRIMCELLFGNRSHSGGEAYFIANNVFFFYNLRSSPSRAVWYFYFFRYASFYFASTVLYKRTGPRHSWHVEWPVKISRISNATCKHNMFIT